MLCHFLHYFLCEGFGSSRSTNQDMWLDFLYDCEEVSMAFALPFIVITSKGDLRVSESVPMRLKQQPWLVDAP